MSSPTPDEISMANNLTSAQQVGPMSSIDANVESSAVAAIPIVDGNGEPSGIATTSHVDATIESSDIPTTSTIDANVESTEVAADNASMSPELTDALQAMLDGVAAPASIERDSVNTDTDAIVIPDTATPPTTLPYEDVTQAPVTVSDAIHPLIEQDLQNTLDFAANEVVLQDVASQADGESDSDTETESDTDAESDAEDLESNAADADGVDATNESEVELPSGRVYAPIENADATQVDPDMFVIKPEGTQEGYGSDGEGAVEFEDDSDPLNSLSDIDSDDSDDEVHNDHLPLLSPRTVARQLMEAADGNESAATTSDESGSDDDTSSSDDSDGEDGGGTRNRGPTVLAPPTTRHEQPEMPQDMPAVVMTPAMRITQLGVVTSIVGNTVVIESLSGGLQRILERGSLLCLSDRTLIGVIADQIGQVRRPSYTVLFRDAASIIASGVSIDTKIYYVDAHARFEFTDKLYGKGTDASNEYDEEPGEHEKEFSDDEEELEHRYKMKREKLAARGMPTRGRGGAFSNFRGRGDPAGYRGGYRSHGADRGGRGNRGDRDHRGERGDASGRGSRGGRGYRDVRNDRGGRYPHARRSPPAQQDVPLNYDDVEDDGRHKKEEDDDDHYKILRRPQLGSSMLTQSMENSNSARGARGGRGRGGGDMRVIRDNNQSRTTGEGRGGAAAMGRRDQGRGDRRDAKESRVQKSRRGDQNSRPNSSHLPTSSRQPSHNSEERPRPISRSGPSNQQDRQSGQSGAGRSGSRPGSGHEQSMNAEPRSRSFEHTLHQRVSFDQRPESMHQQRSTSQQVYGANGYAAPSTMAYGQQSQPAFPSYGFQQSAQAGQTNPFSYSMQGHYPPPPPPPADPAVRASMLASLDNPGVRQEFENNFARITGGRRVDHSPSFGQARSAWTASQQFSPSYGAYPIQRFTEDASLYIDTTPNSYYLNGHGTDYTNMPSQNPVHGAHDAQSQEPGDYRFGRANAQNNGHGHQRGRGGYGGPAHRGDPSTWER